MDEPVKIRGRRRKDDAKNTKLQVRISEEETEMLGEICSKLEVNPSEALRYGIKSLYYSLDKSQNQ